MLFSILCNGKIRKFSVLYIYYVVKYHCSPTSAHKTWRFSQDLDFPSVRHILCRISRAMLSESDVLEPWSRFTPLRARFLSRVSRSRICFNTPTNSSSTLCCMPLEVSMNLQSRDAARAFPSKNTFLQLHIEKCIQVNNWNL